MNMKGMHWLSFFKKCFLLIMEEVQKEGGKCACACVLMCVCVCVAVVGGGSQEGRVVKDEEEGGFAAPSCT